MLLSMTRTTFYRPVRSYPDPLPTEALKIEPPPAQPQKQSGAAALVQMLYPLGGILMSGMFMFSSFSEGRSVSPLLLIGQLSFIPLSVGLMLLSSFFQKRSGKQTMKAARASYKSYLEDRERHLGA